MILTTEKNRVKRYFFDKRSGKLFDRLYDISDLRRINQEAIEFFLHLGYVPGDITLFEDIDCLPGGCDIEIGNNNWDVKRFHFYHEIIDKAQYQGASLDQLARIGGDIFLNVVNELYTPNTKIVVPISGGYDSRAILTSLLEVTSAENIITYSFGTPKTLDFEIGKKIANYLGVKHFSFDLTKYKITEEKLIRIAKLTDGNTDLFQPVYLLNILDEIGSEMCIWSGFTGDGVGGSHYYEYADNSVDYAITNFIQKSSLKILKTDLLSEKSKSKIVTNSIYKDVLNIHEEIFFANHVERYSANHLILNNCKYAFPFMDDRFIKYIFSINKEYRKNKHLYNSIWRTRYPTVFSKGLKENYGFSGRIPKSLIKVLKLFDMMSTRIFKNYVYKQINYIDYAKKLRYDTNFYNFLESCIRSLPLEIFKNYQSIIENALSDHKKGEKKITGFLTAVASLGIILKSKLNNY